ncbi:unnamed protein product [Calicophoron daubneyi]
MSRQNPERKARIAEIRDAISSIPDFPKPGILFRDIFGVFKSPVLTQNLINELMVMISESVLPKFTSIEAVLGLDARGFLLGPVLALHLRCSFIPVRKKGKLPGECFSSSYKLEYGMETMELQKNALKPGEHVIIFDDLLATGGSLCAAVDLIRRCRATPVAAVLVMELEALKGRKNVEALGVPVHSLIKY